ncbi:hypothetical protein [Parafrankia sp. EAN1pec]|uniref:hypothetical protein n=1 Tax=Parafrankia sp. (strain EAN1pec) TaxID=298653 RepID=UPI0000541C98
MDFVRLVCEGAYDVGVLFSRDTDLVPALETVRDLDRHVEVATVAGRARADSAFPIHSFRGATTWTSTTPACHAPSPGCRCGWIGRPADLLLED